MGSIGLLQTNTATYALKTDLEKENEQLFDDKEANCLDNCAYKIFASEKIMRAYIPTKLSELKLTQKDLEKRLNNPNEERGPYFMKSMDSP